MIPVPKPQHPCRPSPGDRVRVVSCAHKDHLAHTVGLFGTLEHYADLDVHIVHFERGGQFSYPLKCLAKAEPLTP